MVTVAVGGAWTVVWRCVKGEGEKADVWHTQSARSDGRNDFIFQINYIICRFVSFELDWFGMECWMFLVLVWCVGSVQFS